MSKLISLLFILNSSQLLANAEVNVESVIFQAVSEQVKNECATCIVEMEIHNKKLIEDIAVPDRVIAEHWKGQTNLVLKIAEESRIVTATIRWKDNVVVANKNIKQGQIITEKDVRLVEKDVTFLKMAYLNKLANIKGWVGKRLFKRGQVIDEAMLKKPIAVKYGQPIKLILAERGLQVVVSGQAKGAGSIGDQIPVFIRNTRKRVQATIIDKSTARVQ